MRYFVDFTVNNLLKTKRRILKPVEGQERATLTASAAPLITKSENQPEGNPWISYAEAVGRRLTVRHCMLEKDIPVGKERIEWQCRCGKVIKEDFVELQPGGIARYRDSIRQQSSTVDAESKRGPIPANLNPGEVGGSHIHE
uniref:Uncharacterized protein n=1 Tax=Rhynchosporium secalis TaxID=38038 RepID=A0A1E1LYG8_RHYSE|nr:uncharacterized protein RSE6_01729 [Rhynchosporium secalis]